MAKDDKPGVDRQVRKVQPGQVKAGDVMAFVYYAKVVRSTLRDPATHEYELKVESLDGGGQFDVRGNPLIESAYSADQFHAEEKVTKTAAAELLVRAYNRPFTVCFEKQDGTERVLRGRLIQPEPLLGRSHVEDLDIAVDDKRGRVRLVDHRTILWLIYDGVKYVVK